MPIDGTSSRLGTRLFFSDQLLPRLSVVLGLILLSLVWVVIIIAASIADDTLQLPEPGRGLLNHYGFQASVLAAPLVLLTAYYAISYFMRILRDLHELLMPDADMSVVRAIIKPHVDSIFLRGKWRNILWFFMFIGVAISIAIFRKLDAPSEYWGNDVFNATYYRYGFVAGNLFFLWLWGFVYPVGFFYALHLTLSMDMIVVRLKRRNLLRLNFLHIDKCGGTSKFGTLNFIIMLMYVWPSAAIYAFHFTHQYTYLSLIAGACAISVLFIVQSIYGIYWVSRTIRSERKAVVALLNNQIAKAMDGARKNFAAAGATLQYRDQVLSVNAFPYSRNIAAAVNILRFAPTALAAVRLFAG
jgi:hypothetical protein